MKKNIFTDEQTLGFLIKASGKKARVYDFVLSKSRLVISIGEMDEERYLKLGECSNLQFTPRWRVLKIEVEEIGNDKIKVFDTNGLFEIVCEYIFLIEEENEGNLFY
jgi:hypothetical protein